MQPMKASPIQISGTQQPWKQVEMDLGLYIVYSLFGILCINRICFSEKGPNYSFVRESSEAAQILSFDYIIVGGGTAGCPLAATLSQDFDVLLLERGGSPYGNVNITNMENFGRALSDLSPTSPSQRFVSEDGVINARARVLGGGTCLNAGFYSRASPEYVRRAGWDGELVNESYPWVEDVVAHEPTVTQWQSAVRDALVEVGILPYNGFTYEHMLGTKTGGTIFDEDGNRHTAADLLEYANPEKLMVLLHATVHCVHFTTQGRPRPLAYGVMFRDAEGREHHAYLKQNSGNEIIISAGALGSPQLLMLSGLGPADHLTSLGVPVLLDLPEVGQGMADNPMNSIFVPSPIPVEFSLIQIVGITKFGSYIEAASGTNLVPVAVSAQRNYGIMSPEIGQFAGVPPKQRTPEAIAKAVENQKSLPDAAFRGGFLLEKIVGPLSSGHLRLRNTEVEDNPSVTFNYFQQPEDLERCVEGMKTIERVVKSRNFEAFTYRDVSIEMLENLTSDLPINLLPGYGNDSTSLEAFCRDTVMTIWHYHGGCQVGRVVDQKYRVMGVDALRVIDGSTFNFSPGTNPQATVMMLGRYMGVTILRERYRFTKRQ